jgi:hypothetical protein
MGRLGVLVVHGIGEQRRGASVRQAADALARTLRPQHAVTMTDVDVDPDGDRTKPASLRMTVGADEWLIAESWWARTFDPPTFAEVLRWAWRVAPGLLALEAWRRRDEDADFTPAGLGMLLLAPFTVTVLALLVVASLVPVRRVRALVGRVQVALTGTIGDSAVLDDGVVGSAIVSRVRGDLRWLAERTERVVVLAHSQGAAIALRVLGTAPLPEPPDLLTFGSGADKLTAARLLHDAPPRIRLRLMAGGVVGGLGAAGLVAVFALAPLLVVVVVLTMALVVLFLKAMPRRVRSSERAITGAAVVFAVTVVASSVPILADRPAALGPLAVWGSLVPLARRLLRPAKDFVPTTRPQPEVGVWHEVRSRHDPVPGHQRLDGGDTAVVHNTGSVLRDHTTYWANAEEFVPRVLDLLGVPVERHAHRWSRHRVVTAFGLTSVVPVAVACAGLWALWEGLPGIGDDVTAPLLRLLGRVPLLDLPAAVPAGDRWLLRWSGAAVVLAPGLVAARLVRSAGDRALARRGPAADAVLA